MATADRDDVDTITQLTNKRADVNQASDNDWTPLQAAAYNGRVKALRVLLEHKANANQVVRKTGATPLLIACQNGHTDIVRLLLENKANVNQARTTGTALYVAFFSHIARQEGYTDSASVLEHKGNIQATNDCATPLLIACREGYTDIVRLLLEHNADVHVQDNRGHQALHAAVNTNSADLVGALLEHKAVYTLASNSGDTALDLAVKLNRTDAMQAIHKFEHQQRHNSVCGLASQVPDVLTTIIAQYDAPSWEDIVEQHFQAKAGSQTGCVCM